MIAGHQAGPYCSRLTIYPVTHLPGRLFEAGIYHGLEALHEPVCTRRCCGFNWIEVPLVRSNGVRNLQNAPGLQSRMDWCWQDCRSG